MILLLLLVFIRHYIGRGRLLFCSCSGCKAASLTELGVGYARENSPLRSLLQCEEYIEVNHEEEQWGPFPFYIFST